MSELNDFLGHILEEITRARIQADYASIRAAKLYAADPDGLLRNFSVPRMRLPNIEITAPLVINDVPNGFMEKTDPALLSTTIVSGLKKFLTGKKLRINTTDIIKLIKEDLFLSKGQIKEDSVNNLSLKISEKILAGTPKNRISANTHTEITDMIKEQLLTSFNTLPRQSLGIEISAKTSVIKEYNQMQGNANVIYCKMSITEDAMDIEFENPSELSSEEKSKIKRLLPE